MHSMQAINTTYVCIYVQDVRTYVPQNILIDQLRMQHGPIIQTIILLALPFISSSNYTP